MSRASCPVCRATNRCAFLCPNCINKVFARDEGQTPIDQLRKQRNELLDSLETQLSQREVSQRQQIRRWQQLQELREARAKAQRAKDALAKAQQQLSQLAAANSSRRHTLEHLTQQTAAARAEVLGNTLPTVLRYQSLTLSHVHAMLAREQRSRLRELTEIFPLRINALRDCGGPIQITVCNIRLPEGGSTPAGGWPEPQATSAALGYLLLFVDQVALIMGGPMLHESAHQASTSSIWQPSSFWNRQPASPAAMLPLNVMTAGAGAGSGTGQAAYNSTTSRYLSTANFWSGLPRSDSLGGTGSSAASLAAGTAAAAAAAAYAGAAYAASALSRAAGMDSNAPVGPGAYMLSSSPATAAQAAAAATAQQQLGGNPNSGSSASASSSGGASGPGSSSRGSNSSRRESDFKAAWDLLQRSLACFLKDKAAKNGMQLPNAWNPLAWLVVYCAVVKRDSRQDGKLVAASSRADATAAAAAAAAGLEGADSLRDGYLSSVTSLSSAGPSGQLQGGLGAGAGSAAGAAGGGGRGWPGFDEDEEEEEDEGWGVVQAPFLPPPPSQPDAVEHWARAMFDQRGGAAAGQPQPYYAAAGGGAAAAAASRGLAAVALGSSPGSSAGGMMSMERIRSMFGRGE
uniref:Uncharacterized protein n=1 Tax=Tetradesmus obliquus TaxID=3088 RepID=A0A383VLN9_TETOB|eukprot:jgi/Sobl393_1/16588/SZX66458.1